MKLTTKHYSAIILFFTVLLGYFFIQWKYPSTVLQTSEIEINRDFKNTENNLTSRNHTEFSELKTEDLDESDVLDIGHKSSGSDSVVLAQKGKPVEMKNEGDVFLNSSAFDSADNLDSAYINEDGSVSKESLTNSFLASDFEQLVTKLRDLGNNENAIERQALLSQKMYDTLGANIYSENYSCGGNVCAVTFKSVEDIPEAQITALSNFSKNYTFKNKSIDEFGDLVMKMLFIAAEDPSQLTVR